MTKELDQSRLDDMEIWKDIKKRAPLGLVLWLIGGIFFYLIILTGWGGLLSGEVQGNSKYLAVIQADLKHIADGVTKIERRLNRIPIPERQHRNPGSNDDE